MNKKLIKFILNNNSLDTIKDVIIDHINQGYSGNRKVERLATILVDESTILHKSDIAINKLITLAEKEFNISIDNISNIDIVDNITAEIKFSCMCHDVYYTSDDIALEGKEQYYKDKVFNIENIRPKAETRNYTISFVNYDGDMYDITK